MNLSTVRSHRPSPFPRSFPVVRSSILPFPRHQANYHKELQAAVDVVHRACRLCVDVQRSLFSIWSEGEVLEKNDNTPVTVADFGVQALISLELSRVFPDIPLVAEEDSGYLRAKNLVEPVVSVVREKASASEEPLTDVEVLEAIDRGGKNAFVFCTKPATYWILDPIDGTKGFLRGSGALYVVGLALIVEEEIVLGVMGCPNWLEPASSKPAIEAEDNENMPSKPGILMLSHVGCGTWSKNLSNFESNCWIRCSVDQNHRVPKARICIPDSQTWEFLPLSSVLSAVTEADQDICENEIRLLSACCGSLCKYITVALGNASVFIQRNRPQTILKTWDHASGMICVQEAGGKVTDWEGNQLDLAADQTDRRIIYPSGGVLVSNGNVHNQVLEIISSHSSII